MPVSGEGHSTCRPLHRPALPPGSGDARRGRIANGERREARIAITNGSGSYRLLVSRNRENPCLGLEMPVTVALPSADELSLAVHGSQALAGCPDNRWQLKRIDDKSFQGTYPDGRPFVLSRP